MLQLLPTLASAQQVPNGDFELAGADWFDTSYDCYDPYDGLPPFCYPTYFPGGFTFDATHAHGTRAGKLLHDDLFTYPQYAIYRQAESAAFVVTHQTLGYATWPGNAGAASLTGVTSGARVGGATGPDGFRSWTLDLSGSCGELHTVELQPSGDTWFDDVALTGALCAEFTDGDGGCAEAAEIDGGTDCDDTDPAVLSCLVLASPGWLDLGRTERLTIEGGTPGERVQLVAAATAGSTCLPVVGTPCVDLATPLQNLGRAAFDAGGSATVAFVLRGASTPAYEPLLLQAVSESGARSSVETVYPRRPDAGPRPVGGGIVNGDQEAGRLGWPDAAESYGYFPAACDPARVVSSPARGTRALELDLTSQEVGSCSGTVHGWGFVATHAELSWLQSGEGDVAAYVDDLPVPWTVAGPVAAGGGLSLRRADLGAVCGEVVRVDLAPATDQPVVFDDLALSGPLCPQFADPDGDGVCAGGVDLDGDRACVAVGEIEDPGPQPRPIRVLIEDFETRADDVVDAADLAPLRPIGSGSGLVPQDPYGDVSNGWALTPTRVTHETLVFSVTPRGTGDFVSAPLLVDFTGSYPMNLSYGDAFAPDPALSVPGQWVQAEIDASGACGGLIQSVWVESYAVDEAIARGRDELLLDQIGLAGRVCAQYVDADGDGACLYGFDLDGDGTCVDPGEPTL